MLRKVEKSKNLVFKDHYKGLSDPLKETIRNRWVECTGMSLPSFYTKMRHENFMPLEIEFLMNELRKMNALP